MGLITSFQFRWTSIFREVHDHGAEGVDLAEIHHPERLVVVLGGDDAVFVAKFSTLYCIPNTDAQSVTIVAVDGRAGWIRNGIADSRDAALYGLFAVGNVDCKTKT